MTHEDEIRFLVSKFNFFAGTRYRHSLECTSSAIEKVITADGYNRHEFLTFMQQRTIDGDKELYRVCDDYLASLRAPQEQPTTAATPAPAMTADTALNFLGDVVLKMLSSMKLDEIKDRVSADLRNDVRQYIADTYGTIQRKVELQVGERKVEFKGVLHSKFDTVLNFVNANEPVFLAGPAGSGKNVLCQQVAKTLGLPFYFSNAVTQEYKLTGFTDANGTFHETQFYKAFKDGGLFMLDEMDASIPEVLIILNAAIANRYFDFPAPIGYVEANPNFRVIAAGNTFGSGADCDYVGRSQLDAASLDRFAIVRIDYDSRIEEACAQGDEDLLSFCRAFRRATQKAGIRAIVSYRAISRMATLRNCMPVDELLDTCLVKSLELDDMEIIKNDVANCGKYTEGFLKLIKTRKAA